MSFGSGYLLAITGIQIRLRQTESKNVSYIFSLAVEILYQALDIYYILVIEPNIKMIPLNINSFKIEQFLELVLLKHS